MVAVHELPEPLNTQRMALLKDLGIRAVYAVIDPKNTNDQVFQTREDQGVEVVAEYVIAKRNGDVFPRPIVSKDGVVITGKRSMRAERELKRKSTPIILLKDLAYSTATPDQVDLLWLLDFKTNQQNGVRMTDAEVRNGLPHAVARGVTVPQMAALFSRSVRWLNLELSKLRAVSRLEELGVDTTKLTEPQLRTLGGDSHRLRDTEYVALANLAADANLRVKEVIEIAKNAAAANSDAAAVRVINSARTEFQPRIVQKNITGSSKRLTTPYDTLRLALDAINKWSGKEWDILGGQHLGNEEFRAAASDKVQTAIDTLTKVSVLLQR